MNASPSSFAARIALVAGAALFTFIAGWLFIAGTTQRTTAELGDQSAAEADKKKPVSADKKKGVDPDDPSIVYDEPYTMNTGKKIFNGQAYDKTALWLVPTAKLVLPRDETEMVRHDDGNAVLIFMEKTMHHGFHHDESVWPVTTFRSRLGCAIKREKGELLIGTFGERSYLEGSDSIRLVVHVPAKMEVVQRPGLSGGLGGRAGPEWSKDLINAAPGEPKPALTKKKEGQADVWLAPTVDDGWHEVPTVPDKERRASKK